MSDYDSRRNYSPFQQLVENETQNAGGNREVGGRKASKTLIDWLNLPESADRHLEPEDANLTDILFTLCPHLNVNSHSTEVAEAITRTHFPFISTAVLNAKVVPGYTEGLGDAMTLVTVYPDAKQEDETIAGFTAGKKFQRVPAGEAYPSDDRREKYFKNKTAKFGKMIDLDWESLRFDLTGQLLTQALQVGTDMGTHQHQFILEKLMDVACEATGQAANTSLRYKGTGVTSFSSDHTAIDGQTNDNLNSTGFGTVGLDKAIQLLGQMKDESGKGHKIRATHIVTSMQLEGQVMRAISSPTQWDTANRAVNVLPKLFSNAPIIFSSPVLDDNSQGGFYYVGAPKRQLAWSWTRRPETVTAAATSDDAIVNDIVHRTRVSYAGGCTSVDYRFLIKMGA